MGDRECVHALHVLQCPVPQGPVAICRNLESFLNSFVKGAPEQFCSIKSGLCLNYPLDLDAASAKNPLLLGKARLEDERKKSQDLGDNLLVFTRGVKKRT